MSPSVVASPGRGTGAYPHYKPGQRDEPPGRWPRLWRIGSGASSQLLEVEHDRFVRTQEVGEDLIARPAVLRLPRPIADKRPQAIANVRRQHAFQVFERRAA